jgi:orotidine-5'-phosphate decarboxylase
MTKEFLIEQIREKQSYLCVGLDTDPEKIPEHLKQHPHAVFEFNRQIIDATKDLCVAYKINTAFYEAQGVKGWEILEKTVQYIPSTHFKIADAKRGDIGNTANQYAKAFFETLPFDALTVAPYMGKDSIVPFLSYENKWAIVLGLTSNEGAKNFELQQILPDHSLPSPALYLYQKVMADVSGWGFPGNLMFVVGATQAENLKEIRKQYPEHFFLLPGVGAQGGSLAAVSMNGMNQDCGLLVNVSRGIIYAGDGEDFAEKARAAASDYQSEMKSYL